VEAFCAPVEQELGPVGALVTNSSAVAHCAGHIANKVAPSTGKARPVTMADADESRKQTGPTMSSAVTNRFMAPRSGT